MAYVCSDCREGIDREASVCPHCGYTPAGAHTRWKWIHGVLGLLWFVTIIGAPVGLIHFKKARSHRLNASDATPAVDV